MAHNGPTAGPASATVISDLLPRSGGRWQIVCQPGLSVWSAVRRSPDGRRIQFLAERSAEPLAGKLAGAGLVEP